MAESKLVNGAIILVTPDIRKTAGWYREKLGFRVVEKFDLPEPFAALYRDSVEIVLVQLKFGPVERNRIRYGAGYDAYLAPEIAARGVKVVQPPALTAYGSRELVFEDVDGRWIGVGCIQDEGVFLGQAG